MRIISQNDYDTSSLSSSPACVSTTPITNTQNSLRGSVARIVPVAPWTITGVVNPSGKTVSAFTFKGHNLTGNATVRLYLYSNAAATTQIYDSGDTAVGSPQTWGNFSWGIDPWQSNGFAGWSSATFSFWFTAVANVAAFKLVVTDIGNADGYLEIGRCYLGQYWQPERAPTKAGFTMEWKELSQQVRAGNMSLRTEGYIPFRAFAFNLAVLSETDRATFMALSQRVGLRTDFFISFYPGAGGSKERDYAAACKFTSLPKAQAVVDSVNLSSAAVTLEEI